MGLENASIKFPLQCPHCHEVNYHDLLAAVTEGGANRPYRCENCRKHSILRQDPRFLVALERQVAFAALVLPETPIAKKVKAYLKRIRRADEICAASKNKA